MRFYSIVISDDDGTELKRFSSVTDTGINNPGALNIEIDVPLYQIDAPINGAFIKIWGISLQDIGAAFDLNNKRLKLYAGMGKGLPLANPDQQGIILQGQIQQAFGNWQGTTQTLDLIVNADMGTNSTAKNIILNWKKGIELSTAIENTLKAAFPEYTLEINIKDNLKLNQNETGFFQTLPQFAQYCRSVSINIIGGTYQGIGFIIRENSIIVFDGTSENEPFDIDFKDLIGQPTWIGLGQIQFKTMMRADLNVSDYITMPQGPIQNTAQSYSQYRDQVDFKGVFMLDAIRHIGNFRQPDGDSWVTVFNAHIP